MNSETPHNSGAFKASTGPQGKNKKTRPCMGGADTCLGYYTSYVLISYMDAVRCGFTTNTVPRFLVSYPEEQKHSKQ